MKTKRYIDKDVYTAANERINYTLDNFDKVFVSFSGGKDSTVVLHMVAQEAIKRNRKIGVMYIDFEAQYKHTIDHIIDICKTYEKHIDLYWICLPMSLRNAVSNFEPRWLCWDDTIKEKWVRPLPDCFGVISDIKFFPFFVPGMEFEEFIVLFAEWYSNGDNTAAFIGIRADESLNRFRTIAINNKQTYNNLRWTTEILEKIYNVYPIYDWRTSDIWAFHAKFPHLIHNKIYDLMHQAGVSLGHQRLCQPYGDDQKRGLWLFHILEPETWYKVVQRVSGANSGSTYINETGNITGNNKISKPDNHTWKSFCNLLLLTMPKITRDHYIERFTKFIKGWKARGYTASMPDEAPKILEDKYWAPSWRRLCKVLLRNDWWCKGLGLTQPKSEAYGKYLEIKKKRLKEQKQEPKQ